MKGQWSLKEITQNLWDLQDKQRDLQKSSEIHMDSRRNLKNGQTFTKANQVELIKVEIFKDLGKIL